MIYDPMIRMHMHRKILVSNRITLHLTDSLTSFTTVCPLLVIFDTQLMTTGFFTLLQSLHSEISDPTELPLVR